MSQLARLVDVVKAAVEADWPGAVYYYTPEYLYRNASLVGEEGAWIVQGVASEWGEGVASQTGSIVVMHAVLSHDYEDINQSRLERMEAIAQFLGELATRPRKVTVASGDYAGTHYTGDLIVDVMDRAGQIWDVSIEPIELDEPQGLVKWASASASYIMQPS